MPLFAPVNDIMLSGDMRGDKVLQPYGEEESLSSAGLEELLPLVSVPHGEGDGVDGVLEPRRDGARPLVQLGTKKTHRIMCGKKKKSCMICGLLPKAKKKKRAKYHKWPLI